MHLSKCLKPALLLITLSMLSACGGGGSDSSESLPTSNGSSSNSSNPSGVIPTTCRNCTSFGESDDYVTIGTPYIRKRWEDGDIDIAIDAVYTHTGSLDTVQPIGYKLYRSTDSIVDSSDTPIGNLIEKTIDEDDLEVLWSRDDLPLNYVGTYYYGFCFVNTYETDTSWACSRSVQVNFSDNSRGNDNVGNTIGTARSISLSSSGTGSYTSAIDSSSDVDFYSISVNTSGNYTISTSSSMDTVGTLYNSSGSELASNDDGGDGSNFSITRELPTGTYYIKVDGYSSTTGSYTINISREASSGGGNDNVGNTIGTARSISLSSSGTGSYTSAIDSSSDVDFYSISVNTSGNYTISTSSSMDTVGTLYNSSGSELASNDDGGDGSNFSITRELPTGTYYIKVDGYSSTTGSYTINISREASSGGGNDNGGDNGDDPGGRGDISWTITWSYTGSEVNEGPDIDLWVLSPDGYRISGVNSSEGNLTLDIDDRGGFGSGDGGGPERIYFMDTVTLGTYEYGVRWFEGNSGTVNYELNLYQGSTLIGSDSGQIFAPSSSPGNFIKVTEVVLN